MSDKFAYVQNNVVIEIVNSLPTVWNNISNFYALESNPEYLKTLGWYVVSCDDTQYDQGRKIVEKSYHFNGDCVIETVNVSDRHQSEEEYINIQREEFLSNLRSIRDEKLANTDWTQALDLVDVKGVSWVNAWKSYRQALRDLPGLYEDTNSFNMNLVEWPEEPNAT